MLIRRAELQDGRIADVRVDRGRIAEIAPSLDGDGHDVIDAEGGLLIPGLHDHHVHLFALAAQNDSVLCGPPHVRTSAELARALRQASESPHAASTAPRLHAEWLRGVGYHESVAGELDRAVLDRWVPHRPLRVQHRSGAAWFLNSAAIERLRLDNGADADGVQRDACGRSTGRLFRCDDWLRGLLGEGVFPSLQTISLRLAGYGVTGVTDASASNGPAEAQALTAASQRGELAQAIHVMGSDEVPELGGELRRAARKIMLDDSSLPSLDHLVEIVRAAHDAGRAVAFHCVTRTSLVFACAALRDAGLGAADRIEHAAVTPPDCVELLASVRATVVTQPNFIRERGDEYLENVDAHERPWLYRLAGLLAAGVPVGGGTDAPYGDPDPWLAMQAAVSRTTRSGHTLGDDEAITPERALALFTSAPDAPGGRPRTLTVGVPADLCLLGAGWQQVRERLSSDDVRASFCRGRCVWRRS